jgi:hypothetical protein
MHAAALRTAQPIRFLVSCWRGDEPLTRSMENGACWVGVELVITIEFVIDLALSPRYESCQSRRKQSIGPAVSHARASSRRGPACTCFHPRRLQTLSRRMPFQGAGSQPPENHSFFFASSLCQETTVTSEPSGECMEDGRVEFQLGKNGRLVAARKKRVKL